MWELQNVRTEKMPQRKKITLTEPGLGTCANQKPQRETPSREIPTSHLADTRSASSPLGI
jgi:hypothetical protein